MGKIIAVVDVEKYIRKNQGEYITQGWRVAQGEGPVEIQEMR